MGGSTGAVNGLENSDAVELTVDGAVVTVVATGEAFGTVAMIFGWMAISGLDLELTVNGVVVTVVATGAAFGTVATIFGWVATSGFAPLKGLTSFTENEAFSELVAEIALTLVVVEVDEEEVVDEVVAVREGDSFLVRDLT